VATAKGKKPEIAATVISSGAGQVTAQGWSLAGAAEELDALAKKLRDARPTRDELTDKGYAAKLEKELGKKPGKFEFAWDAKKAAYSAKTVLPSGSHLVVGAFADPNAAVFMDPDGVTVSRKAWRVEVSA
jgi:hypothetical protein